MFYNLLPGAVGGDVVRGVHTRSCFSDDVVQSLGVVFVERVLGFAGLIIVTGTAAFWVNDGDTAIWLYSALGLGAAAGTLAGLAVGRSLSHMLPPRLRRLATSLPKLQYFAPFLAAVALSVLCHLILALSGHALIQSLSTSVTLRDSIRVFPLGTLAGYFPLTAAGAGARDAALVYFLGGIGVPESDALATSIMLLGLHLAMASTGSVLQKPISERESPKSEALVET
jgi:uncharacterized membrane protein YbhN (UPF0104 family)